MTEHDDDKADAQTRLRTARNTSGAVYPGPTSAWRLHRVDRPGSGGQPAIELPPTLAVLRSVNVVAVAAEVAADVPHMLRQGGGHIVYSVLTELTKGVLPSATKWGRGRRRGGEGVQRRLCASTEPSRARDA